MIPKSYTIETIGDKKFIFSTHLDSIELAMSFMEKIVSGDEKFFEEKLSRSGKPVVSATGQHFPRLDLYADLYSADYTYNPLLRHFFEVYRIHPIRHLSIRRTNRLPEADIALCNDFLATMRAKAVEKKLKKQVADWESKPKKNAKTLIALESKMFGICSRLVLVRMDLYHKRKVFSSERLDAAYKREQAQKVDDEREFSNGGEISVRRPLEDVESIADLKRHLKRLTENVKCKPTLFRHLVGYAWCIEYAKMAGHHVHLVLFFDGQHVEKHSLASAIGQYWIDTITRGEGHFRDCNSNRDRYGNDWPIDAIDQGDNAKREKLRQNLLTYFCKTSQMVQVLPYRKCRLFGRSFVHRTNMARR